ncbi:hypothetical protein EFM7_1589 [Enterococcus faecalis M7]|nr:hypothetical protein OG1X_1728 [Enterococcus faecalis OG1X]ELA05209.1 hypothetical protein EFM7_1589 [Enterococcus faecalis M7]
MDFPQLAKANRDHPKITNLFRRTAKIYTLQQVYAILTNAFCSP